MPFAILATLAAWHVLSWHYYQGVGNALQQAGALACVFILASLAFFPRQSDKRSTGYFLKILAPLRPQLVGASCFVLGALHFVSLVRAEPVFQQMGYLVVLLAYFEAAGMAERFHKACSGIVAPVTALTLRRLAVRQMSMMGMVFALTIVLFYMGLMAVVGFRETWSVALLAAVMILALVFMARVRHI